MTTGRGDVTLLTGSSSFKLSRVPTRMPSAPNSFISLPIHRRSGPAPRFVGWIIGSKMTTAGFLGGSASSGVTCEKK